MSLVVARGAVLASLKGKWLTANTTTKSAAIIREERINNRAIAISSAANDTKLYTSPSGPKIHHFCGSIQRAARPPAIGTIIR